MQDVSSLHVLEVARLYVFKTALAFILVVQTLLPTETVVILDSELLSGHSYLEISSTRRITQFFVGLCFFLLDYEADCFFILVAWMQLRKYVIKLLQVPLLFSFLAIPLVYLQLFYC